MKDQFNELLRSKYGLPPCWEWFHGIYVHGGMIFRGGVPRIVKRGARKGRKNWPRSCHKDRYILTTEELADAGKGGA